MEADMAAALITDDLYARLLANGARSAAVREGVGNGAAERIAGLKKSDMMAQAAEQLLVGTGWLPSVLRTARPAWLDAKPETDAYLEAAE